MFSSPVNAVSIADQWLITAQYDAHLLSQNLVFGGQCSLISKAVCYTNYLT